MIYLFFQLNHSFLDGLTQQSWQIANGSVPAFAREIISLFTHQFLLAFYFFYDTVFAGYVLMSFYEVSMSETVQKRSVMNLLQEFSLPLIFGVIVALIWANLDHDSYKTIMESPIIGSGHFNFHFLMNDIFMVFFFGIAAVEITQSVLPGGDLNPVSKAINPLFATLGGVLGPVGIFFLLNGVMGSTLFTNGWGIPTATDIALAWLVARMVFGAKHPAVSFLLLLAIADDAIGLGIIAIFYPDPAHPVQPIFLLVTLGGMVLAFILRKEGIKSFIPYLLLGGIVSWIGLFKAGVHPSLALVFIVPFMPSKTEEHNDLMEAESDSNYKKEKTHSTLVSFEHNFKLFVDLGLFGFGLSNAGVLFSGINNLTWIVFLSLLIGKTVGISLFSNIARLFGSPLPDGMNQKTLMMAGLVAGLGLTVALFVAGQAYTDTHLTGAAKMGALFSGGIGIFAIILGKVLKIKKIN